MQMPDGRNVEGERRFSAEEHRKRRDLKLS
jgi:hypothetical protein